MWLNQVEIHDTKYEICMQVKHCLGYLKANRFPDDGFAELVDGVGVIKDGKCVMIPDDWEAWLSTQFLSDLLDTLLFLSLLTLIHVSPQQDDRRQGGHSLHKWTGSTRSITRPHQIT